MSGPFKVVPYQRYTGGAEGVTKTWLRIEAAVPLMDGITETQAQLVADELNKLVGDRLAPIMTTEPK